MSTSTQNGQPAPRRPDRLSVPPAPWGGTPIAPEQFRPPDIADPAGDFLHTLRPRMLPAEQLAFAQRLAELLLDVGGATTIERDGHLQNLQTTMAARGYPRQSIA